MNNNNTESEFENQMMSESSNLGPFFTLPKTYPFEFIQFVPGDAILTQWVKNMASIQTSIEKRIIWKNMIKKCLKKTPLGQKMNQILTNQEFKQTFQLVLENPTEYLGKGVSGIVFKAILTSKECNYLPIVIKVENLADDKLVENYESHCMTLTNQLMENGKSIHFPFFIERFVFEDSESDNPWVGEKTKSLCTVMEYVEGNLTRLFSNKHLTEQVFFSCYCQIVFTLLEMATEYGMVHGDLHYGNIMYSMADKNLNMTFHLPSISGISKMVYSLSSTNIIIKLIDFGICSSKLKPRDYSTFYEKKYEHWQQLKKVHPLVLKGLGKYARDLLFITIIFYEESTKKMKFHSLTPFFESVLDQIHEKTIRDTSFLQNKDANFLSTEQELTQFVKNMFHCLLSMDLKKNLDFEHKVGKKIQGSKFLFNAEDRHFKSNLYK